MDRRFLLIRNIVAVCVAVIHAGCSHLAAVGSAPRADLNAPGHVELVGGVQPRIVEYIHGAYLEGAERTLIERVAAAQQLGLTLGATSREGARQAALDESQALACLRAYYGVDARHPSEDRQKAYEVIMRTTAVGKKLLAELLSDRSNRAQYTSYMENLGGQVLATGTEDRCG